MGNVLHPVGSLPPSAYWLRRLIVLLGFAVLLVGGWWLIGGRGSASPGASGPGSTSSGSPSSSSTSPSPSTSTSHSPSPSTSTSHSPSTSPSPTLCPESVVRVLALTSEASFPAGKPAKLTVEVTNHGTVACKRDVGQAALELVVSSGSTRVWSSDDCNPGGGHAVVALRPGQTFSTTVAWDRKTSAPGCPSGKPAAAPGGYTLVARNLTLKSAPTPFSLG